MDRGDEVRGEGSGREATVEVEVESSAICDALVRLKCSSAVAAHVSPWVEHWQSICANPKRVYRVAVLEMNMREG